MRVSLCLLVLLACVPLHARAMDLYVSPSGDDRNPGTSARPLRTLEGALEIVRRQREMKPREGATVWLAGGGYVLQRTLRIGAEHSGHPDARIVLRAVAGEDVRISGAHTLPAERFAPASAETMSRLDPAAKKHVVAINLRQVGISDFGNAAAVDDRIDPDDHVERVKNRRDLIFDDHLLQLARWPNSGFARDIEAAGGEPFVAHGLRGNRMGVLAYAGERPSRWAGEKDVWLHGYWFWDWADAHQRVAEIDRIQKRSEE